MATATTTTQRRGLLHVVLAKDRRQRLQQQGLALATMQSHQDDADDGADGDDGDDGNDAGDGDDAEEGADGDDGDDGDVLEIILVVGEREELLGPDACGRS